MALRARLRRAGPGTCGGAAAGGGGHQNTQHLPGMTKLFQALVEAS